MSIKQRGFASLPPERRVAIAKKGAAVLHASGRAHRWTAEEAKAAGRIGGNKSAEKRALKQVAW